MNQSILGKWALMAVLFGSVTVAMADQPVQKEAYEGTLAKENTDFKPRKIYIDTFAFKAGPSFANSFIQHTNGGVPGVAADDAGYAWAVSAVFNNDYMPFVKPYIDFERVVLDDRSFNIHGLGLRHDFMPNNRRWEPYMTGGIAYTYSNWNQSPAPGVATGITGNQAFTATAQGGVDFYFTPHWALDASLRYDSYRVNTTVAQNARVSTVNDTGALSAYVGIVYRFGAQNEAPLDDDNDGVMNLSDACPNTPAGAPVDARGCALDSDGDHVIDLYDLCPGTLKNVPVDETGCPPAAFAFNLMYEYNSFKVSSLVNKPVFKVVAFLKKNSEYEVRITGFSDHVGSQRFNLILSQKRANEAADFLIEHGIDATRIHTASKGKEDAMVSDDSEALSVVNRRILIEFYKPETVTP